MTNHSILGNVLCPDCGSDDFELTCEPVGNRSDGHTVALHCLDCGTYWNPNDFAEVDEPKPLKF